MLPTVLRTKRPSNENAWLLIPKVYVYIGASLLFLIGSIFGAGYTSRTSQYAANTRQALRNAKPTVLVTGGLGFIGSHVVDDLLSNAFNVVIFDDMSNGKNLNRGAAAILLKDITSIDDYAFIPYKIDYIIHLAAAISVEESTRVPEKYERINFEGSRKVLEWAALNGVKKVVAASTGATYGIPKPENLPLREEDATGGICAYATTKMRMEHIMKDFNGKYGLPSTALRFFNVYGPRQDPHSSYSGVISWFMDEAMKNGTIKVNGDGTQYRDFVYVKDVARAIRIAMLSSEQGFDVFNVCTGVKTTINKIASTIVEAFKSTAAIQHVPFRQGDVTESVGSTAKAEQKLHFQAIYSLKQGIEETRDWFRQTNHDPANNM